MKATLPLGRIGGVRIGLHWSVLGIVLILVVVLAFTHWPRQFPGYPVGAYLAAGLITAALFVASILAHELAHALVAKREGVEVGEITLWLLGGLARLRSESRGPGAELRIAGVGPAMSVAAGLLFGLLTWLAAGTFGNLTVAVLSYLAVINIVLAVFNLIPAAPLDGGRILRAALWKWWGDRYRATVWSARAGRGFGLLLIGFGIVRFLVGTNGSGLWWVLIGLFVVTVATAEERQAELGSALAGLRVTDVMTPDPEPLSGNMTVSEFLRDIAMARPHSTYPLLDPAGRFQGMITLNRLRGLSAADRESTALSDIACTPDDVPRAAPDEPLNTLLGRMDGCPDGRALVFEGERLVGLVSPSDISRAATVRGLGGDRPDGADIVVERSGRPRPR